ncbi:glycoside hydrolase family 30 protein [Epilithonimonas arachidiradicis]|uniref:Glucosylceramidase n=1 Tax=Epilithonimonas arachidiradicis TaxID=1617282 RepID=A0A420CXC5_9FLAO|nr:glycoside hydrolase family 30 beta sandwich domain-containing protein [Epilithonimonas arachidiradicis]RKE83100.1 glucosylceramidase [Epilithonimonas arachidiradicis]GGG64973.1 glucosylceramidase [Epilithonimonas arachidiradicis]
MYNNKIFPNKLFFLGVTFFSLLFCQSSSVEDQTNPPGDNGEDNGNYTSATVWLTKADETVKLQKQNDIYFKNASNNYQTIDVDSEQKYQMIDGFGYTLTGGSVQVINQLSVTKKEELLQDLFSNNGSSIAVSYLRLSIGASDLNSDVFSYNDMPAGQTDPSLSQFSLAKDQAVIDMLKKILTINPNIKIIATPWSPPVWMKDNGSSIGGSLLPQYYGVYAQYFVKYIQAMKAQGITIDAITPQNEPLHPGNNPSMYMTSAQQGEFIKNHLGPAFHAANINTKIILYDHNCDKPDYPMDILADAEAAKYVDGSAFHLYAGNISVLSNVHLAFPSKNLYFTEQWTGANSSFSGDFVWHMKNVIIGSMRNWSKVALEWNVANDASFNPHTTGGCTECKGAITINSSEMFTKNVAYYIIAQASKFVPQNSQRIASTQPGNLSSVAFQRPDGKVSLIVLNEGDTTENFNIRFKNKTAATSLTAKSVATFVF